MYSLVYSLNFSPSFLGSSCQVHPRIQELSQDLCLEPLIADTAGSSFSACPAVTHSISMNSRHLNKMLTIMAFAQLCLTCTFPQTATLCYHLSFPPTLQHLKKTHEQEFHSQLYTACTHQLEQVQTYLIHEK